MCSFIIQNKNSYNPYSQTSLKLVWNIHLQNMLTTDLLDIGLLLDWFLCKIADKIFLKAAVAAWILDAHVTTLLVYMQIISKGSDKAPHQEHLIEKWQWSNE